MKDAVLIVRVTSELKKQAISKAKKDRRTISDWIRIIIEDKINDKA
jgi:predicted HicB family RNase H-like nuclease